MVAKCQILPNTQQNTENPQTPPIRSAEVTAFEARGIQTNGGTSTVEAVINVEVPARPVLAATGANVLFAGIAGIVLAVIAGAVVVSRRRS